jgi:hypothetical protein
MVIRHKTVITVLPTGGRQLVPLGQFRTVLAPCRLRSTPEAMKLAPAEAGTQAGAWRACYQLPWLSFAVGTLLRTHTSDPQQFMLYFN